jgi:hypothetical protein
MSLQIHPYSPELPELSAQHWPTLDQTTPMAQALLHAQLLTLENEAAVMSLWDGSRLRGVSVAFVDAVRGHLWISRGFDIEQAALPAKGEEAPAVCGELLSGWIAHARQRGLSRVLLGHHLADGPAVAAARALGFRMLKAATYFIERSAGATDAAGYYAALGKRNAQHVRRDLRRIEDAGGRMELCTDGIESALEACWPMHLELLARHSSSLRYRGNFLAEIARRLRPEQMCLALCKKDDGLLGYAFALREGSLHAVLDVSQSGDRRLHLQPAIGAWWILRALEEGAHTLALGPYNDAWKTKVSTVARPLEYGFIQL